MTRPKFESIEIYNHPDYADVKGVLIQSSISKSYVIKNKEGKNWPVPMCFGDNIKAAEVLKHPPKRVNGRVQRTHRFESFLVSADVYNAISKTASEKGEKICVILRDALDYYLKNVIEK